jgi:hypothetical protein
MRWISFLIMLISVNAFSQWKDYKINSNGDTLNRIDHKERKQGPWVVRYEELRGEPGYEEEGWFRHDRKEGEWRIYNLTGDLTAIEFYRWGMKDSVCKYFNMHGELMREERWRAFNPDKEYDTLDVEDVDKLDTYKTVIIKNEGAAVKHGEWRYYDPPTGFIRKIEVYTLGKLEGTSNAPKKLSTDKKTVAKPKEVVEFEKKHAGKKKVRYKDGTVTYDPIPK